MKMLTRWDKWYSQDNLSQDKRILAAPPSQCAHNAAAEFLQRGKQRILDVACGIGRDTFYLEQQGLSLTGVDASLNGLRAADQVRATRGAITELVNADACLLPFETGWFDGVYCFGLLHEFVGADKENSVRRVVSEIRRVLRMNGVLALAVLAGNPEDGLPHVQMFTRQMFECALAGWNQLEIRCQDDVGCTNQAGYRVWYGLFEKMNHPAR
jgi:SAM-dependent methyltransferase